MKTEYAGIDYSLGRSNVDRSNGIHFGVISLHAINMDRLEEFESQYGNPHCPKCGNECEAIPCHTEQTEHGVACYRDVPEEFENYECPKYSQGEYACKDCEYLFDADEAFPDSPIEQTYERDGYALSLGEDGDIFVLKSPYYTRAQYCSPCAPGAGYLTNPCDDGPKTYCLGADWFEDNKPPYPVYLVADVLIPESESAEPLA
jgi:hypothetical protein